MIRISKILGNMPSLERKLKELMRSREAKEQMKAGFGKRVDIRTGPVH